MKHGYYAELESISIRPLSETDLEYLRSWRNDEHISSYFQRMDYITATQQKQWFREYLKDPNVYYWAVVEGVKTIGSLSIYDVKGSVAEIGKFMIGDPMSHGKGYGYKSIIMALQIGFEYLKLKQIKITVHEKNISAKKIYDRAGFEIIGSHPFDERGDEIEMIINSRTFKEVNPMAELIKHYENPGGYSE